MNPQKPPSLWQVLVSVLAAMFGVQSEQARRRDFSRGKPHHYIFIGILMAALFVCSIVVIVQGVLMFMK